MSTENPPAKPAGQDATKASGGEGKSPEEIQAEIDATREELGDTVTAVAERADVKKQARDKVDEVKDAAANKAEEIADKAKQAAPDSAGAGVAQAQQIARRNPVPLAVGGAFLAGMVVGRLFSR